MREVLARRAAEPPAVARTWLQVARAFVDAKWEQGQAPGSRRSIANVLTAVTVVLFDGPVPVEVEELVREALPGWSFNTGARTTVGRGGVRREVAPPQGWAGVVAWMEAHSRPVTDLADPDVVRLVLGALTRRLDGRPAAANTVIRRRQVFEMAVKYAVSRGDLEVNPLVGADWQVPRTVVEVDRRAVVNAEQAGRLFAAVARRAPELEAFFATIYHAAVRPGELQELRLDQLTLPVSGWGEVLLEANNPEISPRWSDSPHGPRQARELKHRAKGEVRPVPLNPRLVAVLRRHIDTFGVTPDGRLFRSGRGNAVKATRYLQVWREARKEALSPAEQASPLARGPTTCGTPRCRAG
ncbi:tyrosine-type recombinase/integrase [Frankia canadensis]|uniref:tyrosine-type recombinase/integrase n=1 Tax=Frankia canadensis TaxID=1836972 RepID=UPI001FAF3CBD|nr:hypothetical protein [Frankia canadensis]